MASLKVGKKLDAKFRKVKKACLPPGGGARPARAFLSCIRDGLTADEYMRIEYRALSHGRKAK